MRISLLTLFLVLSINAISQNTWVANNNPGAVGGINVTTGAAALQDAIDAAADGDIIYVTPSSISYGTINVGKDLSIRGAGIRPVKEIGTVSTSDLINLVAGSSGTEIIGMICDRVNIGAPSINIADIVVMNCRFKKIDQVASSSGTLSNILIQNNIITTLGAVNEVQNIELINVSNVKVSNNIVYAPPTTRIGMAADNVAFENNIFVRAGTGNTFTNTFNCSFFRNIFYGTESVADDSNSFVENLSFGGAVPDFNANPANSGNIVDQDPLFVDFPLNSSWSDLFNTSLQAGSPAIQDINDRTKDIGPTGGISPFNDEGNSLPLIQSLQVPGLISQGSDLPVQIKGKGN